MNVSDLNQNETVIVTRGKHKGRIGYVDDFESPYAFVFFSGITLDSCYYKIPIKYLEPVTNSDLIKRIDELSIIISKERHLPYFDSEKLISLYEEYIYVSNIQTQYHINSLYCKPSKDKKIFISCSKHELYLANNLAADLRTDGYSVFLFSTSINIGENIIQKISENINTSDYIIPIISESYISSQFCIDELTSYYMNHIKNKPDSIIPIRYNNANMPPLLSMYIYFDYSSSNYDTCLLEIRHAISKN